MKRTTKRILVLLLCTTLLFASAHSIYSNTFTLEVQAAEVVITAEAGAAVIEYLWGLLLTAGLVEQVYTWSERALQINNVMDKFAAYPEITADMTLNVTVNGKELEVTYDQYMTYLRDNIVDGTGAVQTNHEVFTVLSGGGGKNGGDKDHQVQLLGTSAGNYMFVKMIMGGYNLSGLDFSLPDDKAIAIDSAINDLTGVADYSITGASQICYRVNIQNPDDIVRPYSAGVYLNFNIEKTWTGHTNPDAEYATLYFKGTNDTYGLRYPTSYTCMPVAALVPCTEGGVIGYNFRYQYGQSYGIMFLEFQPKSVGTAADDYNNFSFQSYNAVACKGTDAFDTYFTVLNDTDGNISNFHGYEGLNFQRISEYGFETICHSVNKFFDIQRGTNYLDLSISGDSASIPLLIVNSFDELKTICDGLLNQWDNSVFVNYAGNTGEGVFNTNAYNHISESALSSLVEAILRGNASTDAVIDAANEVNALRELEPVRLPEFYPDLYPEYLPEADPAEYPEIYPDYDPVTNPNPTPSKTPDPDRVVNVVVQPIVNPNPAPNPNPDPDPDDDNKGGGNGWDSNDVTFDLSEYFPFCIPFDLIHAFKLLSAEAEAPYWEFPIHAELFGFVIDYTFVIDMSKFESLAKIFRTCETIGFCIGLILITRNIIRG